MEKQHHSQTERHQSFSVFSDTIITNRNNPKIKQIRALLKRSERERTGLALVEGLRLGHGGATLSTTCASTPRCVRIVEEPAWTALLQEQRKKGLPCLYVSSDVFQSFSLKDNPQGIAAVVSQQWSY
ncbi:hypothetical protein [Dictyobacter vulcani]|uniref:hypothetical protein n=1 Tax=Dictyobacter vulcani TaxID=2607529 RepID=UPI00124F9AD7|nr:hypothetical protein [Dictyobacter vulcani]